MILDIILWVASHPWVPPLIFVCILYPLLWFASGYQLYPNGPIWPKKFRLCSNCDDKKWLYGDPCPGCIGAPK